MGVKENRKAQYSIHTIIFKPWIWLFSGIGYMPLDNLYKNIGYFLQMVLESFSDSCIRVNGYLP